MPVHKFSVESIAGTLAASEQPVSMLAAFRLAARRAGSYETCQLVSCRHVCFMHVVELRSTTPATRKG
jgi:hypothetical protein